MRSLLEILRDTGIDVVGGDSSSMTYRVADRIVTSDLLIYGKLRSATAVVAEVGRRGRRVLVVCEAITAGARQQILATGRADLIIKETGEVVLAGRSFGTRSVEKEKAAVPPALRRRRAAQRVCILSREKLRQKDIARAVRVTQQSVSAMSAKEPLPTTPMAAHDRRKLLAELAATPIDDGHIQTYWYGLETATDQAQAAAELGRELDVNVLLGGEVAADGLRPWRVPSTGLVYAAEVIDLSVTGLVEASRDDATLTLRVPSDPTIWATAAWWAGMADTDGTTVPTVDPVVVLEDLFETGDTGDGAPEKLAEWIAVR